MLRPNIQVNDPQVDVTGLIVGAIEKTPFVPVWPPVNAIVPLTQFYF